MHFRPFQKERGGCGSAVFQKQTALESGNRIPHLPLLYLHELPQRSAFLPSPRGPEEKAAFKTGRKSGPYQLAFLTSIPFHSRLWLLCNKGVRGPFLRGQPRNEANAKESKHEPGDSQLHDVLTVKGN